MQDTLPAAGPEAHVFSGSPVGVQRTGQLYRLLPSALPVARQSEGELRALQQKPECAGQARSRRSVELESVLSSDDRLWPADPARSLCCIQ